MKAIKDEFGSKGGLIKRVTTLKLDFGNVLVTQVERGFQRYVDVLGIVKGTRRYSRTKKMYVVDSVDETLKESIRSAVLAQSFEGPALFYAKPPFQYTPSQADLD
ncbi:MAG: hypothetical protein Q7K43_00815 [Candidatus Woesearchaeota archaeon]|nr:hypothetical protein [Candidatus Woesearchaeota archaeon]